MSATIDHTTDDTMTCPTCGASQAWSGCCRRCKCDLSDLRAVWLAGEQARKTCLRHLREGCFERAVVVARQFALLRAGDDAARLRAACCLLRGDFAGALRSAATRGHQK